MSQAPGWYRDPFLRGHERYWDGRVWTQGTRPEGVEDTYQGDLTQAQLAHPDVVHPAAGTRSAPAEPSVPSPGAGPPVVPSFAPLGAPSDPTIAPPAGGPTTWAPPAMGTAGVAGSAHGGSDRHRRRAVVAIGAAALVLAGAGISAALVLGGSGNASAQEAVDSAATQTMNAQSADVSMSMDVSALGHQVSIAANGAVDFAHKTATMNMTISAAGKQASAQEILDGSTLYENISGLGTSLTPSGKPWVSENVSQANQSSSALNTLDPTSMLQHLVSIGGTVTSLGQTTHDGTSVTEYSATLPASVLEGQFGSASSSLRSIPGLNLPDLKMNIYVTQGNLLEAMDVPSFSVSVGGQTVSMSMSMNLSNYGTTVNVTPPPANEVQPFSQLGGGGLGNSGSTGNTGNSGSSI